MPAAMQGIVNISSDRNDRLRQQKYNKVLDLWDFHISTVPDNYASINVAFYAPF